MKIVVTLAVVAVAVLGTFVINSFYLMLFEGKTINSGYLPTLVDSALYTIWFLALASGGALLLKPRPFLPLGAAAIGVFCFLVFSGAVWVNPEASLAQKVLAYFQSYAPSFMVLPSFLLVGFVVQQATPNLTVERDASRRGRSRPSP